MANGNDPVDFMAQQQPQQPAAPVGPTAPAIPGAPDLSGFGLGGLSDPVQSAQAAAAQPFQSKVAGPQQQITVSPQAYTDMSADQALSLIQQTEDASGDPTALNYRFDPTHTASGLYQITNTNWKQYAPQVPGADQYGSAASAPPEVQKAVATAMYQQQGFAPWAPYNPRLAQQIGWKGPTVAGGAAGGYQGYQDLLASGQAALEKLQQQQQQAEAEENRLTEDAIKQMEYEKNLWTADRQKQAAAQQAEAEQLKSDDQRIMDYARQTPTRQAAAAAVMHLAGPISLLTALGGALTRQSGIAMMGALNGVVEGIQQGAENQYNDAMDKWRSVLDAYKDHAKNMQVVFEKTAESYGTRADAHEKAADFTRTVLQDRLAVQQLKVGNSWQNFNAQMKINDQLTKIATVLDKVQFAANVPKSVVDFYARQQIAGDTTWRTGLSRTKEGVEIIRAVDMRVPELAAIYGITPEQVATTRDWRKSLGVTLTDRTKFVATMTQFVNNFDKQIELVRQALLPGVGGATPIFNRWIQAGRQQLLGDPEVSRFDMLIRGLAREHQRLVTGVTSNAQLHASAQHTGDELINKDMTAGQILSTMDAMKQEGANALASGNEELGLIREQLNTIGIGAFQGGSAAGEVVHDKNGDFQPNADGTYTNTETQERWRYDPATKQWSQIH